MAKVKVYPEEAIAAAVLYNELAEAEKEVARLENELAEAVSNLTGEQFRDYVQFTTALDREREN